MEDFQLIKRVQEGSEAAFRQLVERHKDRVYNTALSLLGQPQDAEDVSQEVFVEFWKKAAAFRGEAALSTWLYRVTVNRCRDLIKFRKRKKRFARLTALYGSDDQLVRQPVDPVHPGILLEQLEEASLLMKAIDALPEQQKIALMLHKMEQLPQREIATIMNKSTSAVEGLLHRAKGNLRQSLRKHFTEAYEKRKKDGHG